MVVEWTPNAIEDMAAIWEYYSEESLRAATKIADDIKSAVLSLINFPQMAPVDPFLAKFSTEYRSLTVRRFYKIVYKIEGERIYIMMIFDCRQNPLTLRERVGK